ncbi:MAG TPA: flagellar biosynthesis protein FlhF [Burkholderiales bacterium]|nr:flagellar biosynthesis protein FlhF [Burkholderiales bacterium]
MRTQTFTGATSREVLHKVRQALGEDALILSNRGVEGGIEVVALSASALNIAPPEPAFVPEPVVPEALRAATPGEIAMHTQAHAFALAQSQLESSPLHQAAAAYASTLAQQAPLPREAREAQETMPAQPIADAPVEQPAPPRHRFALPPTPQVEMPAPVAAPAVIEAPVAAAQAADIDGILSEIQSLKTLLRKDIAAFASMETAPASTGRSQVLRELLNAGFSAQLSRKLAGEAELTRPEAQAMDAVAERLAGELQIAEADEMINKGGVYALVGPTGVGKTTTVAKLAARAVVRFGASKVALLTTDSYRIGAHDQLRIYGRILSVPVHTIRDAADLTAVLAELAGRHLILIDTIGMSQRDRMVAEQAAMLSASAQVKRVLLVSTTANTATLNQVVSAYKSSGVHGCILTKTDEAANLAPALDAVIRHELPVHYITDGQRVPEDLQLPEAAALVRDALHPLCDDALELMPEELALIVPPSATPASHAAAFVPADKAEPAMPVAPSGAAHAVRQADVEPVVVPAAHTLPIPQHAQARVVHG